MIQQILTNFLNGCALTCILREGRMMGMGEWVVEEVRKYYKKTNSHVCGAIIAAINEISVGRDASA